MRISASLLFDHHNNQERSVGDAPALKSRNMLQQQTVSPPDTISPARKIPPPISAAIKSCHPSTVVPLCATEKYQPRRDETVHTTIASPGSDNTTTGALVLQHDANQPPPGADPVSIISVAGKEAKSEHYECSQSQRHSCLSACSRRQQHDADREREFLIENRNFDEMVQSPCHSTAYKHQRIPKKILREIEKPTLILFEGIRLEPYLSRHFPTIHQPDEEDDDQDDGDSSSAGSCESVDSIIYTQRRFARSNAPTAQN